MNYIVLDLEWNQCPDGKEHENPRIPFEILQIGAVKLDRDLNLIDQFSEKIRPVVYPEMHGKIQEILQIEITDFQNARLFPEVAKDFFAWCGPYTYFCTWGPSDLTELQRNLTYHGMNSPFPFPLFFYDIQKIFSIVYEDRKTRRNLEFAVDYLHIPKDHAFHDALSDSFYTAMIMREMSKRDILKNYSIDCYQLPRTQDEEIYVVYETYSKYISREFENRQDALRQKELFQIPCYLCQKNAALEIPWFVGPAKNYHCLARCETHGYLRGKIRFKKSDDGKIFCIRTIKQVNPDTALGFSQMHTEICLKKQLKKKKDPVASHTFH